MKHEKRAPKNEAPSFHLADSIAGKLLLSRAYVLFKPARHVMKFFDQSHQLFLTTLPFSKAELHHHIIHDIPISDVDHLFVNLHKTHS